MISQRYIMELLRKFAKSPAGQEAIKEASGADYKASGRDEEMRRYGLQMKKILYEYIKPVIHSFRSEDIIVDFPEAENGQYTVRVSFNAAALRRDSLYPEKYKDGLENIVLLFAHGYRASNYAYGPWSAMDSSGAQKPLGWIRSRISRPQNPFLHMAVAEFNRMAGGKALAYLEEKYN